MIEILSRFTGAVMYKADCTDVRDAVLQAVKEGSNLQGADLQGANLQGADLREANLQEANLQEANLQEAHLRGADLQGANLQGADLREANLQEANLRGANLQEADLREANLQEANLQGADLQGANLRGADLQGANLQGADLQEANLQEADLREANLQGANLRGAELADSTRLPTGELWKEYREVLLPALCTAAGKTLEEVAAAWDCHEWSNCPMHAAFEFDGQFDGPNVPASVKLLRPRIEQFVQLFDAKLIPCPCEAAAETAAE